MGVIRSALSLHCTVKYIKKPDKVLFPPADDVITEILFFMPISVTQHNIFLKICGERYFTLLLHFR